ncbi:glycoside hydrolase family 127 protein, partial [Planctomycetota bacterium]
PVSLKLRIPGWAKGATLKINGKDSQSTPGPGSYVTLKGKWSADDKIELELPLDVRLIEAHPNVVELRNSVAVMRGPVVYCLELPKQQNGESIWNDGVFLPENIRFKSRYDKSRLGGITVLTGRAMNAAEKPQASISSRNTDWENQLYREFEPRSPNESEIGTVDIELIPYFAWANRGVSWMEVWIPLAR